MVTYQFDDFGLSEMVFTAAELRLAAEDAPDFPGAAAAVVGTLREKFVDGAGGPALPLVRLFVSRRWADLSPELRASARTRLRPGEEHPELRCLVVEATAGVEVDRRDPARSGAPHPVFPLPSAQALADAPMIAALVRELGLPAAAVLTGQTLTEDRRFGVFHVPSAVGSSRIPDQEFVAAHGIASVLGFGGVLPGGNVFAVVMYSREAIGADTAEQFRAVAVSVRTGLLAHARGGEAHSGLADQRDALRDHLAMLENVVGAQAAQLERAVQRLRAEADLVDALQVVGRRLTSQLDLDLLVEDATDAATKATGAAFGAFFYNLVNEYGESYTLYALSGVPRAAFERFPMPRNTAVFGPTFTGEGVVRSDDITADPRYGHNAPYRGMPEGHLPVCSYLAVPVVSATSKEVLGGFFFGHPERGRFTRRQQQLAEGIAGYAAIGLDNARLYNRQRMLATELQRSMLPTIPDVPGFTIVPRYLPAATGSEVGGDWIDVIELPAGRSAFVVGDVMGRGLPAATVMGQIRTAIRSYAMLDLPPAEVMRHVSELAGVITGNQFITCVYAVHDPVEATLTYANAGHLPPAVVDPAGQVRFLTERLGMPLRVGHAFNQRQVEFPAGSSLVLYTDGLVERRRKPLSDGIEKLRAALIALSGRPVADAHVACDDLIRELAGGLYDDDVALLYLRDLGAHRRAATMALTVDPAVAAHARRFATAALTEWGFAGAKDQVQMIVTELVANAVKHSQMPVKLRLYQAGDRLVIDVMDRDRRVPQRMDPALDEEHHRGLFIVDAYAERWGSRPTADGKVVWAEVLLPTTSPTPRPGPGHPSNAGSPRPA